MPPTFANGKICYIDIPATDVAQSADFYAKTFGWKTRRRGDGSIDASAPIAAYWLRFHSTGERRDLSFVERTLAFGPVVSPGGRGTRAAIGSALLRSPSWMSPRR